MDPRHSVKDVTRCSVCGTSVIDMYCEVCHVSLCKLCTAEHISDEYDKHKVVPFEQRNSNLIYPKCATHQSKTCEFQCRECDTFVCSLCMASEIHRGHTFSILSEIYNLKKEAIKKDTEELKKIVSPKYEEIANYIESKIASLDEEYAKLTEEVTKHGEVWHREIDKVLNKTKNEIDDIKHQHLTVLQKHLEETKEIHSLIEQTIVSMKEMEGSNEMSLTMAYKSKNKEFRKFPPRLQVSLPTFIPKTMDREQSSKLFGTLIPLSMASVENGYKQILKITPRKLLDKPELITTISTEYEYLCCVTCFNDEEIWTSGVVSDITCFDSHGSLIKTIKTKSGGWLYDIAVTAEGDLVYTDCNTTTVNKVKNGQTEEIISLQGWDPRNLCVTSCGDLLVIMFRDDKTETKVVRYSGYTEKQTIQFDDEGNPLYPGNSNIEYITENRNLDICVANYTAGDVVVVSEVGKLRFRYTGQQSTENDKTFQPHGIATDSQYQILIADYNNSRIHILDQNGQFIRYIDNCGLTTPYGLCVDSDDNLFVAEFSNGTVKKIKYLM
ncbi:tripartite motif-containing protein 2-like [Saccostrea echinata]|uniref:tripartite motif-containing protein 2-like n=1 Tax=Saccostrea echinata TaxID=191078 RepID=UPI002A801D9D|nr:tripartite motif-containing protein 2-like [Saccostrea echinata]